MNRHSQKGIIEIVVVIVLAIVVMSLFGVNLRSVVESDTVRGNFAYVRDFTAPLWNNYAVPTLSYLWENIFSPFVVTPLKGFLD